ncbi:MAG TPA: hypothetical protein PLJ34_10105, partial [Hyphomicrobiales bacterium]|nr:hypothetical protein [Hyphomicrobiales bacterium]
RIERAAAGAVVEIDCQTIKHGAPDSVELGLSSDDHEAQSIGWPCVGAHAAVLGLVAARVDVPLAIVPRGSTIATAGASDAND